MGMEWASCEMMPLYDSAESRAEANPAQITRKNYCESKIVVTNRVPILRKPPVNPSPRQKQLIPALFFLLCALEGGLALLAAPAPALGSAERRLAGLQQGGPGDRGRDPGGGAGRSRRRGCCCFLARAAERLLAGLEARAANSVGVPGDAGGAAAASLLLIGWNEVLATLLFGLSQLRPLLVLGGAGSAAGRAGDCTCCSRPPGGGCGRPGGAREGPGRCGLGCCRPPWPRRPSSWRSPLAHLERFRFVFGFSLAGMACLALLGWLNAEAAQRERAWQRGRAQLPDRRGGVLPVFVAYRLSAILVGNIVTPAKSYFDELADAWLHGRLYLIRPQRHPRPDPVQRTVVCGQPAAGGDPDDAAGVGHPA